MKSFGRLLRRLRGHTALEAVAALAHLDAEYLGLVEAGRITPDETRARHILTNGLALNRQDTDRLILGLQLYDLGLTDNDLRQLVIAAIQNQLPTAVRAELKRLYCRYTAD